MKTFPMFLQMQGRHVVIAGGGEQAAQKCRLIFKTEAAITLLAPTLDPELAALHAQGRISWQKDSLSAGDFADAALVFIATGCPAADACLHGLAKTVGATVNVVDQPHLCDAITPSIVDRSPVVVAIGTEGTAPVLARQIKTRMEEILEPRLGDLAALAGRLRDRAAARLQPRQRRDLWRWVFAGPVRETHAKGSERGAARMIKTAIDTGAFGTGALGSDQTGSVALVGAGPGCKDLITLRGVQRLQEADVIYYDRLVDPEILDLARRDAERVYVGKAPGCHHWPQEKITGVLLAAARQGKRVVRLKCGDPGIFARGAEEAEVLESAGIPFEIVPGVTAASAASAAMGGFLTERGACDTLIFVTGQSHTQGTVPDWQHLLQPGTRIAVYMGVAHAGDIAAALLATGYSDEIQIDIVSRAQGADEIIAQCSVDNLVHTIAETGISNPAILFISRRASAHSLVSFDVSSVSGAPMEYANAALTTTSGLR